MGKCLLYINKDPEAQEKIRKVRTAALLHHARLLTVSEEELEQLPERAELMKMIGFGPDMPRFLATLRKQGVRVDLKCIETETNRDWSLLKLYAELQEEHEKMQALK